MNRPPETIAIKGSYGCGNLGDDVLMVAAFEIVKRMFPSESIVFLCRDASYIHKIVCDAKVISPSNRYGKVADIILYGGGTQFFSFPRTRQKGVMKRIMCNIRRPAGLTKKVFRKMKEELLSEKSPRSVAIGIGLGPFVENSRELQRTTNMFARMEFVAVRDITSYELCEKWGCANVSLGSDLCYLPGLWQKCVCVSNTNTKSNSIERVGIIVRDWLHTYEGDDYVIPLFQVVDKLRSEGKEVEFISFAKRSDNEWAKRLKDIDEQFKAWDPEKCTISEFMELLSGYDAFVTARYHGAVFASILGKPVVCIEVEPKLRLISDLLGDGARLWTYPFNASECLMHISDLAGNYCRSVECLRRVVEEQGTLTEKMVDGFKLFIRDKCRESQYDCQGQDCRKYHEPCL